MNRISAALFLLAIGVPAVAQTPTPKPSADETEVRRVVEELNVALQRNDAAVAERIYADDYAIVEASGRVTRKAERVAALRSGDLKFETFVRETESVRVFGETAVTVGRVTQKGTNRGRDASGQFRNTVVFVKKGGRWQVVAAQSTRIAP